jgi:4-hydroxybenzoate polyprenyltransferase
MGLSLFFILAFAFIFLKSLINVIFFDIKDIGPDGERGLKTVPVLLGKGGTIKLLKAMNILAFVPVIAGVCLGAMPAFSLSLLPLLAYTYYYLDKGGRSGEKGVRYISYALAESETIWWVFLLVIGRAIFPIF